MKWAGLGLAWLGMGRDTAAPCGHLTGDDSLHPPPPDGSESRVLEKRSLQLVTDGDAKGVAGQNGVPAELLPGVWPDSSTTATSVPRSRRTGSGYRRRYKRWISQIHAKDQTSGMLRRSKRGAANGTSNNRRSDMTDVSRE